MANLSTTYLGMSLKNPLVIASSGLTSTAEKISGLEKAGAGAVVLKSIFEEQINNEVGNLMAKAVNNKEYPEAADYISNYIRDYSVSKHLRLLKQAKEAVAIPVIASVNCVGASGWTSFAKDFEEAGADALELNVFYVPNSRHTESDKVEKIYIDVVSEVKKQVSIPVSVKIGVYFSNLIAIAEKLKANGAKGLVMFNRFYEPDINLEKLELSASEIFSSPSDLRRSLRWTGLVSSQVSNLEIAASTGIHDADAVIKQLLAGAQVAQLCSTIYKNGAGVVGEILSGISAFMKKWNFENISDFRGRLSYRNIPDPMLYERSQFMKYFSSK